LNEYSIRIATVNDAALLAPMNAQLIHDEGHRNTMTLQQLTDRMRDWLKKEYQATIFEVDGAQVGYALFRLEPEFVYLRQFFVKPEARRQGIAKNALDWLRTKTWKNLPRIRIDVLVVNKTGIDFWRSVGFSDYCITMEQEI